MLINRMPETPKLSTQAINLLTTLCFRQDDPIRPAQGIFIFASITSFPELAKATRELLDQEVSDQVFVTGSDKNPLVKVYGLDMSEADTILKAVKTEDYPKVIFHKEIQSSNTLSNVTEMLKNKNFRDLKSLFFVHKCHAAGRGYLTLRKFFPTIPIWQKTFPAKYRNVTQEITPANWHTFEFGRQRVWGEFLRIKEYGQRGDIAYNEVKNIVDNINKLTL